jgi:hypothetical protein
MSKETALINLIHHLVRKIPDLAIHKHLFGICEKIREKKE